MNTHAFYHKAQSEWAFPISRNNVTIRFRAAAGDLSKVELIVNHKFKRDRLHSVEMCKRFTDSLYDYFEATIDTDMGRTVYYFIMTDTNGNRMFYTEDGAITPCDSAAMFFPAFQIPFVSERDVLAVSNKFRNAVIYQIFPDRFYTKTPKLDWSKKPTAFDFFGGDLHGVTDKLEYIASLGVNTLYLTPIHPSSTNHHYDVEDYYKVSCDFGGDEALKELIEKAHGRGMNIMLDGVFNHCSCNNPIFKDVEKNGRNSEYYDWFIIDGDRPTVKTVKDGKECNYQTFAANLAYMPKLNGDNDKVREYVADVTTYWIKKYGVDAWRLDVADDVSPSLWREVRKAVKKADPNAIMIGEYWTDPNSTLGGDVFDGVMNYGLLRAVRDYCAFGTIDASGVAERLIRTYMRTNSPSATMMMNLIGCHDTPRFFTLCKENLFAHRAALCTMFFYDGMPMVYYGDELPMSGDRDPDCRRGFDWSRIGGATADMIKSLACMRANESSDTHMTIDCDNGTLIMTRAGSNTTAALMINMTDADIKTKHNGTVKRREIIFEINGKTTEIEER